MKTLLLFFFVLTSLLAGAFFTTHQIPDVALLMACAVAASITAWTLRQYERTYKPLTRFSPMRLRMLDGRREVPVPLRWAA